MRTNSEDCQGMFPFMVYRPYKKERSMIYEWLKIRCLHHSYKKKNSEIITAFDSYSLEWSECILTVVVNAG